MRPFRSSRGRRLLPAAAVVLALAACTSTASSGWTFAPPSPTTSAPSGSPSGSAGGSASASASASAGPSAPASGSASASGSAAGAALNLKAQNIAWTPTSLTAPAKTAFTITVDNEDASIPHDLAITDASGKQLFHGDMVTGVATKTYNVPALAAGTYKFACTIHPQMTGELKVQ